MPRSPFTVLLHDAPMTLGIALTAIIVSGHWWSGNDISGLVLSVSNDAREPWRYLTATLPHASALQLVFNVLVFIYFGFTLERGFGSWRFLALFAVLAAGSSAAEFALAWGALGLSGVLYGFFTLLWVLSRREERFRGAVGPVIKIGLIGLFFFYIIATIAGTFSANNVAHVAGALLGALLGALVTASDEPRTRRAALLTGCFALFVGGAVIGRPYINLSPAPAWELADIAIDAALEGDYERTIELHRRLVEVEPHNAALWFNLGKALGETGRHSEAVDALQRAVDLAPENESSRAVLQWNRAWARSEDALRSFFMDDFERSAALYREAIALDNAIPELWHGLGHALSALHQYEEAARAFRRALDLDPLNEQYQQTAAWAAAWHMSSLALERFLAEDYERSVVLYRHALRADETVPMWWHNLGVALVRLERFTEARRALTKALELDPENPATLELIRWIDESADDPSD